jgi:hypothetical protein
MTEHCILFKPTTALHLTWAVFVPVNLALNCGSKPLDAKQHCTVLVISTFNDVLGDRSTLILLSAKIHSENVRSTF